MVPERDEVFFFDLRMICAGYAYYLTYTMFDTFTASGREIRTPDRKGKGVKSLSLTMQRLANDINALTSGTKL